MPYFRVELLVHRIMAMRARSGEAKPEINWPRIGIEVNPPISVLTEPGVCPRRQNSARTRRHPRRRASTRDCISRMHGRNHRRRRIAKVIEQRNHLEQGFALQIRCEKRFSPCSKFTCRSNPQSHQRQPVLAYSWRVKRRGVSVFEHEVFSRMCLVVLVVEWHNLVQEGHTPGLSDKA